MKVFFVKYNDPIYVKLEKLDIMIRLANQQNIAQVLAELKEWVDFITYSKNVLLASHGFSPFRATCHALLFMKIMQAL